MDHDAVRHWVDVSAAEPSTASTSTSTPGGRPTCGEGVAALRAVRTPPSR